MLKLNAYLKVKNVKFSFKRKLEVVEQIKNNTESTQEFISFFISLMKARKYMKKSGCLPMNLLVKKCIFNKLG